MQEEVFGVRDRSYSAWHRRNSTRRYIGIDRAQLLAMVDLDCSLYVEYDDRSKEPLALIETARDVGQGVQAGHGHAGTREEGEVAMLCGAL